MKQSDQAIINEACKSLGIEPENAYIHVSMKREPCKHEWNNDGRNPTHCLNCGIGIIEYSFCEAP